MITKLMVPMAIGVITSGVVLAGNTYAQLPDFPGSKTLTSESDKVGIGLSEATVLEFEIHLDAGFDETQLLLDVVPAEFDVTEISATCGDAQATERNKPGDKLRPDHITWDLDADTDEVDPCDPGSGQTLTVVVETDKNPGHGKRNIDFYEPTSCGPLWLNDGAVLIDPTTGEPSTLPSNSLQVVSCPDTEDADCVDTDGDGWSISCGDCDDDDAAINPGALELCNGIDDDCDGIVPDNEGDNDGDGALNCEDACPDDPNKIDAAGVCGCGVEDIDSDFDGVLDCNDGCPTDPAKVDPGVCGCNVADTDTDTDGTADCLDGCPNDIEKVEPGICGCGVPEGSCSP